MRRAGSHKATVTLHMDIPNGHTLTGTYHGGFSGMMSQVLSRGGDFGDGHVTLTR